MKTAPIVSAALWTGLALSGCRSKVPNPEHCVNNDGDAYCEREYGEELPFCVRDFCEEHMDYGCAPERPEQLECWSPCGGGVSADEDMSCVDGVADGGNSSEGSDAGSGSGTEGSTGDTGPGTTGDTTGVPACADDSDCNASDAPFCGDNGECVSCQLVPSGNSACSSKFPGSPICTDAGCVACTEDDIGACAGTTPICDVENASCVACTFHEQCPDSACHIAEGSCFPEVVVHVDGDGGQDFETIADALANTPDEAFVIILHELDNDDDYNNVALDDGRTIAILAAPDEKPLIRGTGGSPGILVSASSSVYLRDLTVIGNTSGLGISADNASLFVDRSSIVQNSGGGILLTNGSNLSLRNSFVGGSSTEIAVQVNESAANIIYSSLAPSSIGVARALACSSGDSVFVRNSILVSGGGAVGDEINCPGAQLSGSATEETVGAFPNANPDDWFVGFNQGDLHLQNQGLTVFQDVATWSSGDPPTDIDGNARPDEDGTPDYAGADVP